MKKFFKAASILAAVSMMFAFASCQQDPETPSTSGAAPVFKAETKTVDLSSISVASVTEVSSDNEKVATATKEDATATKEDAKVTVKSVSKGTAKITAKVTGADSKTGTAEISVTVAETGKITVSGTPSVNWDKQEEPANPFAIDITAAGELHDALNAIDLKAALPEGTYDGITLAGNGIIRGNDKSKVVLETKGTISFSVTKGQKITLKVGSTSGSNTSAIQLSGAVTTDIILVAGTSYDPLEYTATETGLVTINAYADSVNYGRGARFTYIAVE